MHCTNCMIYCASPSEFYSFLIHPPELSGKYHYADIVVETRETWREMAVNFAYKYHRSYLHGSLTRRKILRHGPTALLPLRQKSCWGFLSPLKIYWFEPADYITYRVIQEEKSVLCEVILSMIMSKKVNLNMCPIPNDYGDIAGAGVAQSVLCLTTNWTTGRWRFDPRQRIFPLTSVTTPALRTTLLYNGYRGVLSRG
jgi:hypothetical protein